MTYDQQLIFKQNSDSGDNDDASIQPLLTEPATPENADRPLQHLRRRTERVRAAVETLLYLADYDRAFALRSNAKFALADSGGNYTLSMVSGTEDDLWVYPALTPGRQSGGRNKGGRVYVGGLPYSGVLLTNDLAFTLHSDYTGQRGYADGSTFDGGGGNPALTLGANGVTLTLAANSGAPTGTISATITGSPKRKVTITYGTSGGSTSIDQIIAWVNNPSNLFTGLDYGPSVFFRASRDPATPGSAAPTPFADAGVLGAYDAEAHQVTVAQLVAFFAVSDNRLKEGEGLAVAYVPGPVESGSPIPRGGRRQSLWDLPTDRAGTKTQNTTPSVGYSLFNTGREPEKIPGSVPVGKLIGGEFVFIDGTRVGVGSPVRLGETHTLWDALVSTSSPTGASQVGYGGGPAYNADAAGTTSPQLGPGTVEATFDQLLADLANQSTNQSGARRIGIEGMVSSASSGNFANRAPSIAAESVRGAIAEILGIGNPYGMAFRVHETGHTMRGGDPLRKNFALSGMPASGAEFLRGELHYPADQYAISPAGVNETSYWSVQPLVYNVDANDNLTAFETGTYASATTLTLSSMTLTRFTNVFAKLPLIQDGFTAQPVPMVFVYLSGATGAADAPDGFYYVTARNTGTGVITLKKANGSDPDFTGMSGTPLLTFYTSVRDGNDRRYTRRFWHHWSRIDSSFTSTGAPGAIIATSSTDSKLAAIYTPSGNAGALQCVVWANRVIWASTRRTDGGVTTRRTVDILTQADKERLDGNETGHTVSAVSSHHHADDYTKTYTKAYNGYLTLFNNQDTTKWVTSEKHRMIADTAGEASDFPNHVKTHVLLNVTITATSAAAIAAGATLQYTLFFFESAAATQPHARVEICVPFQAAPGFTMVHQARAQILVPVHAEAPYGDTCYVSVETRTGIAAGAGTETLTVTEIGSVLVRVDS